jgi:UDP-N-acetylmuramate dehydrogenase
MASSHFDDLARTLVRGAAGARPGSTVVRDAPIAPLTSLKVGGVARLLVRTTTPHEAIAVAECAAIHGVPTLILGGGSNVVVADKGFDGLVIRVDASPATRHSGIVSRSEGDVSYVDVEAGCQTAGIARWAARQGLAGFEWACGIPGTIGGAVAGNAGAYGGDMASVVTSVRAWLPSTETTPFAATGHAPNPVGIVTNLSVEAMGYGYRTSRLKRGPGLVLGARLRLRREDPEAILARIDTFEAARRQKQPTERSCGSVFRNPPGEVAGRLLEEAGMKGRSHGGASVSPVHANWIINRGNATAEDVVALIREGQATVQAGTGIRLQLEVLLVGDWDTRVVSDLIDTPSLPVGARTEEYAADEAAK